MDASNTSDSNATETQQYVHGLLVANANGWLDAVSRGKGYEEIANGHVEGIAECVLRIKQGRVQ
jgi:hypothetical protein